MISLQHTVSTIGEEDYTVSSQHVYELFSQTLNSIHPFVSALMVTLYQRTFPYQYKMALTFEVKVLLEGRKAGSVIEDLDKIIHMDTFYFEMANTADDGVLMTIGSRKYDSVDKTHAVTLPVSLFEVFEHLREFADRYEYARRGRVTPWDMGNGGVLL